MGLKAIYPILYLSHQYAPGDELPANDPDMTKAWITAGTAEWTNPAEEDSPKENSLAVEEAPAEEDPSTVEKPPAEAKLGRTSKKVK